jgi:histidine kinase
MTELLITVRIDFSALGLYGRDSEIQQLQRILVETKNSPYPTPRSEGAQLVEIKGYSGCGKSALAETLKSEVTKLGGHFVVGKFDQEHDLSQSYAIRQALHDLFVALVQDERISEHVKESLIMHLSEDDIAILANIFPHLPQFLEGDSYEPHSSTCRPEWALVKMKIAIRKFLETVCDPARPIIMVIDDIQWINQAGLALLQLMATNTQMDGLILVCSYRENEVTHDHPASCMLKEAKKHAHPENMHSISIGNLQNSHIVDMLVDLSSRRPQEVESLVNMLQARTHGNPFFLLQYLRLLEKNELIRRSTTDMAWTWSENDILANLNVTDNVAEFVSHNIQKLPPSTREALKVAACFGWRFDINLVSFAMKGADISAAIEVAVQDGLVEKMAPSLYKFTHDRIQEASYSFACRTEREVLHYAIGRMVKQLMDENEVEDAIWIVTDHLNKGRSLI